MRVLRTLLVASGGGDVASLSYPEPRAFHALGHADGLDPWSPDSLYHWSVENLHTDAERHCASFILNLWNEDYFEEIDTEHNGRLGRFDALRAIAAWDHAHRPAFAVWALNPWWP